MNDLLQDFLTETHESLDVVDVELVRFEKEPNNEKILGNIFRLVHTIKGTCGFLGLPRLEALTHAAETVMGKFRDGMPVTGEAVTLILATIDRIKEILAVLEESQNEPDGSDDDLIAKLEKTSLSGGVAAATEPKGKTFGTLTEQILERPLRPGEVSLDDLERAFRETPVEKNDEPVPTVGTLVTQQLERPLKPGEVSLDELERAFRETESEIPTAKEVKKADNAPADNRRTGSDRREDERRDEDKKDVEHSGVKNQTLRVQVDTLERLMTMVSELVLTRNQLLEVTRNSENSDLKGPFQRLSNITGELQDGVMKTRMQPIGNAWAKLPRVVRDLSAELGKRINLVMQGEETELDRQLLELIKDPLTHMVRNSADHGIESAADRRTAGKPEEGTIRLAAYHEGGHIIVEISDDGRGLDSSRIRDKAIRLGLINESDKLSESQLQKFIFNPGFSTAAKVTSVSGRGVGMDVVKTNIDQIGGTIDLKSTPGKGTTFKIKIPLTLAIVNALIVEADSERFAIPQIAVVELVHIDKESEHKIEKLKDSSVLRLRDKLLPLVDLRSLLALRPLEAEAAELFVVVMQVGSRTFGIIVDQVFHTEEIVVKPMSQLLRGIEKYSGKTILGDGSVIIILDPNGIASSIGGIAENAGAQEETNDNIGAEGSGKKMSLLVFRACGNEIKAVPLSLVTRLEEIDAGKIEFSNGKHMVQYRGGLMPLLPVREGHTVKTDGSQPLLVFIEKERSLGIMVDEIVDIVEDVLEIEIAGKVPGVLGSAIIAGKATEILDVGHYLPLAFEDWLHRADASASATRRILFVDDSVFFRNMLTPVLNAAGYEVKAASSGVEALAILERDIDFDFVISDIEMPGMTGFEFAEKVRAAGRTSHLMLIALSSLNSPSRVDRGKQAGFHHFVAKFDRGGLIALLKQNEMRYSEAA
jgi:two-component system, chemotaxis family, sensor kinase CheA